MATMTTINIKLMDGQSWEIGVTPATTVGQLKHLIAGRINEVPSRLKLAFPDGRNVALNDDGSKLLDRYRLASGSTLILHIAPFQVIVINDKKASKAYDVSEETTVQQLKTQISNVEKTPVDQFYLVCESRSLDSDHNQKLKDCGIRNGSTILMNLRLRGG